MVETVEATGSTNADMLIRAHAATPDGAWLRAETQTGGKGRRDREWVSPPGNLYCSTIVRVKASDPPAPSLALLAGVALHDAIKAKTSDLSLMLKWPNDLLLDGAKCAGILLERDGDTDAVIIGFGVNITTAPQIEGRKTAALADCGAALAPEVLLDALVDAMARRLAKWRSQPLASLFDEWQRRAHPLGTRLEIMTDRTLAGTFAGLDGNGALRLSLPDGRIETITAGDVALLG